MREDVQQALTIDDSATIAERTIDITTTGRRTGQQRRIEICFYRFEDQIYLSGIPGPRTRDWLRNLEAEPRFVFHLKNGVIADLAADGAVITDPAQRRRIFTEFVETFNARHDEGSAWPRAELSEWVERSPLAKVTFADQG